MSVHRLTYGAGDQSVRSVPLRSDGRAVVVPSASYAIVDTRRPATDASHELATGSATIDPVATTITAAAGKNTPDPWALTVASAVGIVAGRRYLLTSGGRAELVCVAGVSGTTLRLASQLPVSFSSGATFSGVELAATVPAAVTGEDDYLDGNALAVRWEPSGLAPYFDSVFVERVSPAPLVSPEEVLRLDPTLANFAGEAMSAADATRLALDDFSVDMLTAGVDDDQILAGPIGRSAIIYRAAWHLIKHSTEASAVQRAGLYHARYVELRVSLLQGFDKQKSARLTSNNARVAPDVRSLFAVGW